MSAQVPSTISGSASIHFIPLIRLLTVLPEGESREAAASCRYRMWAHDCSGSRRNDLLPSASATREPMGQPPLCFILLTVARVSVLLPVCRLVPSAWIQTRAVCRAGVVVETHAGVCHPRAPTARRRAAGVPPHPGAPRTRAPPAPRTGAPLQPAGGTRIPPRSPVDAAQRPRARPREYKRARRGPR